MDEMGWVKVADLLHVPSLKRLGCRYEDVLQEASTDPSDYASKQRLEVTTLKGSHLVRACQGHSLQLNYEKILEEINPAMSTWIKYGLHGTFRCNIDSIIDEGLDVKYSAGASGSNRVHIHFAASIHDTCEHAGVRSGTDTVVMCDLQQMYNAGMRLYRSRNNVILTPGNNGCVSPEFIAQIYDRSTGEIIYSGESMPEVEDNRLKANRSPHKAVSRRRRGVKRRAERH
jgi:2'-phosphotransferase